MPPSDHLDVFAGLPVIRWNDPATSLDPAKVAWRLDDWNEECTDYGDMEEALDAIVARTGPEGPVAVVVGLWSDPSDTPFDVEWFVGNAHRFGRLRALFIGDMTQSDDHIESFHITLTDVTPLLEAVPTLEVFGVHGLGEELELGPVRHEKLRTLIVQTDDLRPETARTLGASDLPALIDLELHLSTWYADEGVTPGDLDAILAGRSFPALRRLGLRAAGDTDSFAAALASAPVVAQLTDLDLSLGTLGDEGVEALLAGQPLTHLRSLSVRHHYVTPGAVQRLVDGLPGVHVDASGRQDAQGGERRSTHDEAPEDRELRQEWRRERAATRARLLDEARA
ncbi:leucine-rich repeat domain-containing protein [Catenuloplanes japonicus]|uniref:leucine-rich repeat domain-containing protein n=1 Tax=Catenuloplanes japonicus TaxID=33876 RepID=UPI0018DD0323|nr:leucine-rich repeat domain-containing protein [Catenuloplanes japonicus]